MSLFEYKPLAEPDTIRLITIWPAENVADPIHCSITQHSLSMCDSRDIYCSSPYTALSYAWGSPEKVKTILVDGTTMLKITANLFATLRDLRHETRPLFLWANGICINQDDPTEKSAQVAMMGRIYIAANHTAIHLPVSNDPGVDESGLIDAIRRKSSQGHPAWHSVLGKP